MLVPLYLEVQSSFRKSLAFAQTLDKMVRTFYSIGAILGVIKLPFAQTCLQSIVHNYISFYAYSAVGTGSNQSEVKSSLLYNSLFKGCLGPTSLVILPTCEKPESFDLRMT
jgi:hypothetical protein